MNQNTTIETIREAIEEIGVIRDALPYGSGDGRSALVSVAVRLGDLANRLEAAPQPPVEQSEPAAEHPQTVGQLPDGREIRLGLWKGASVGKGVGQCPHCNGYLRGSPCDTCGAICLSFDGGSVWIPPAVIEPEPELDEFEQWLTQVWCKEYRLGVNAALQKYREIISRKGDK